MILVTKGGFMRTFLLKAKNFLKRNIYPITVSVCTVLVLGIVTISAYSSIRGNDDVVVDTNVPTTNVSGGSNAGDKPESDESKNESQNTATSTTIIFDLPFEKAAVSKVYTDSTLLYDATTKLWCTHQGLDFACKNGQPTKAVFDGRVVKVESSMMNGTVVHLKVSDNLIVVYKGLASNVSVKEGDMVKKGDVIGVISGLLAEKADGIHLHLELMKDGKLIDPTEYFSFNK